MFHTIAPLTFCDRYCSSRDNLTIDHVLPTSRGGEWKWENLVRLQQVQHEHYLSSLNFSTFYWFFFLLTFLWYFCSLHLRPTKGCNMFYMLAPPRELINYILMCPSGSTIWKMVIASFWFREFSQKQNIQQFHMIFLNDLAIFNFIIPKEFICVTYSIEKVWLVPYMGSFEKPHSSWYFWFRCLKCIFPSFDVYSNAR